VHIRDSAELRERAQGLRHQRRRRESRIWQAAETALNRKEFGLNWNAALETGGFLVGDDVKISLQIQAVGQ